MESRDQYGYTPLMCAAGYGSVDIVQVLLDNGANIHHKSNCGTALHLAAGAGHDESVKLLIKRGANPHIKDGRSETPLDYAKQNNRSPTIAIIEAAIKSTKGKND